MVAAVEGVEVGATGLDLLCGGFRSWERNCEKNKGGAFAGLDSPPLLLLPAQVPLQAIQSQRPKRPSVWPMSTLRVRNAWRSFRCTSTVSGFGSQGRLVSFRLSNPRVGVDGSFHSFVGSGRGCPDGVAGAAPSNSAADPPCEFIVWLIIISPFASTGQSSFRRMSLECQRRLDTWKVGVRVMDNVETFELALPWQPLSSIIISKTVQPSGAWSATA